MMKLNLKPYACLMLCSLALLFGVSAKAQSPENLLNPQFIDLAQFKAEELFVLKHTLGSQDKAFIAFDRFATYTLAVENLRREMLLSRCSLARSLKPDQYYFDPKISGLLDRAVDRIRSLETTPVLRSSQGIRYVYRRQLWALEGMGAAEKTQLLKDLSHPLSATVMQRWRTTAVLESMEKFQADVNTGLSLAYPVVTLKKYLVESGEIARFMPALKRVAQPSVITALEQLNPLEPQAEEDWPRLSELGEVILMLVPQLQVELESDAAPELKQFSNRLADNSYYVRLFDSVAALELNSYSLVMPSLQQQAQKLLEKTTSDQQPQDTQPPAQAAAQEAAKAAAQAAGRAAAEAAKAAAQAAADAAQSKAPTTKPTEQSVAREMYLLRIFQELETQYPAPAGWPEAMLRMGPRDWTGNAASQLCANSERR